MSSPVNFVAQYILYTHTNTLDNQLLLPSPKSNFRPRIRIERNAILHRNHLTPLSELKLILQKDMAQRNLNLIDSKEPTGASVLAKSKRHVVRGRRHTLRGGLVAGDFAQAQESVGVVCFGIGVYALIPHAVGGDEDV